MKETFHSLIKHSRSLRQITGSTIQHLHAKNVLSGFILGLNVKKPKHDYLDVLRKIEFHDEGQDHILVFLTNSLCLNALDVASLYQRRWQIDLFLNE